MIGHEKIADMSLRAIQANICMLIINLTYHLHPPFQGSWEPVSLQLSFPLDTCTGLVL